MDETYNIIQLLNKENIKPRTIVDYQRTTGNFQPSKPNIKKCDQNQPYKSKKCKT